MKKRKMQNEPNETQGAAGNLSAFLSELKELSEKHGIVVGGCSCCGSPYLYPIGEIPTNKTVFADNLKFDKETGEYTADTETEIGGNANNDNTEDDSI